MERPIPNKSLNFVNFKIIKFCERFFDHNHIQILLKYFTEYQHVLMDKIDS